nr:histone deacetylase 14 [Tanacetum cinerariifolium]
DELRYLKLIRNLSNVVTNDMFQPWRALTTIINLCLTGKTSGFERPRAPVLQILWGIVNRAHLDYAERICEEFTQSIHTFIEDKRNLAKYTHGKKKATLIVIPSILFTKLIIYHLQRKHKFHPRPDSPLHLPNEEPVLGYLKFSAKGTKREVFGMLIPGSLITADIQGASYYQEYLAKVAKHQRYMASETGREHESPASKPTKTVKKSKLTALKVDPRPPVSKPATSKQPEPKPTPAKTQGKKCELTIEISNKPSKAKKSRPGSVSKRRKPISSLRSMDESVAKDVPEKEPRVDDEEADVHRVLEESLKSTYDVPRGALPPVVIREPESEKYQPLLEVPGKGKEKAGLDPGAQDEGQAGSNPDEQAKGQARPDPGNAKVSQPLPSPVVHAGSDLEHMDLDVADVSTQPPPEQIDEGFTATAYPKVSKAVDEVLTNAVDWAMQDPLRNDFRDLPEADMKEIIHQCMWETDSYKTHEDHMQLYEALKKSMNRDHFEELAKDQAKARKKKKKSRELPKTPHGSPPHQPPPPPPPAGPTGASGSLGASGSSQVPPPPPPPSSINQEGQSKGSAKPSSSKTANSAEYQAWMMTDIRLRPSISLTPADLQMDDDMALDAQAQSSDNEDIRNDHIPKTGDIAMLIDWFCKRREITELKPQDLEGLAFEIIKAFHPNMINLQCQMEEFHKLLTDSGSRPALSISKMKENYYPDAGLEQMVPDQMWIEEECKYDIAAMYGISYWWFQRQRFYINRHTSEGDRRAVRTHIRILSVFRIKVFSMYGYDYMKKIVIRRADLNEQVITERDFKYLYPSDFKDLYLLNLRGHLNHLPPKDKKILTTAMIMCFNEMHKFSDGTLQQIDEALDYRVKEFKINRMNPGLNTRFWTMEDVDRSKEFMFAI